MTDKDKAKSFADAEVRLGDPLPVTPRDGLPAPTKTELLTPDQWARRKGLFVETRQAGEVRIPAESHFHWSHAAAAALHGWASHEHHASEPMKLAEADYDAALKAVTEPGESGQSRAHKPALSPHCTHDAGHRKAT